MTSENEEFLRETDVSSRFLFELSFKGQKEILMWVMKLGLIASYYKCPVCGENMNLHEQNTSVDGYEWRCWKQDGAKKHDIRRNVRANSCFSYFDVKMTDILLLIMYWYLKCDLENVPYMFEMDIRTASDLFTFCKEMCIIDLIKSSVKIGGKNVYIEVDVCKLGETKYSGDEFSAGKFIMGGIDKRTKDSFFTVIDRNTRRDFFNAIEEWVLPGSVLLSECWQSYNCYSDEEFIRLCTTKNLTLKNHVISERDKSIAAARSSFEGPLRKDCDIEIVFDRNLAEYIWRKKCNNTFPLRRFKTFLWNIIKCYQPLGIDKQC